MKKLLTTASLFVVTSVAIISFIAPTVFGQEQKTAKANPSPAGSIQQAVQTKAGMDPERLARITARMKEQVCARVCGRKHLEAPAHNGRLLLPESTLAS